MSSAIDETLKLAASTVPSGGVVLFSKSYCPYCLRAKRALLSVGIAPVVVELDERSDGAEIQAALLERTGQRTVPSAWLDGKHVGGSDDVLEGVESGLFKDAAAKAGGGGSEQTPQQQSDAAAATTTDLKKCGAGDGLPCLCTDAVATLRN